MPDSATTTAEAPSAGTPARAESAKVEPGAEGRRAETTIGLAFALAAYGSWGLVPIYFKAVETASPLEILAHRVVWGVLLLSLVMTLRRAWPRVRALLSSRRTMATLLVTTGLIGVNWFTYIYAVVTGNILEASLGYYINPLVNVALGVIVLKEGLNRVQLACMGLAAGGVIWLALSAETGAPWLALILAFTFGFYALLRKRTAADALTGLTVETALLLPVALGCLGFLIATGGAAFASGSLTMTGLLVLAGPVTILPLLWFTEGARRLRLVTVGMLQYLAPTGQFLLAVLLYGEAFTPAHAVAFTLIWAALALYTADSLRRARRARAERKRNSTTPAGESL